ncbi:MAG TPA: 1-acyl-sn-glycerol-3-phosphate acyltransferase, partial [Gemmatimonadaceae bacterium]|nr:1-acyl-sn-glycerol-3-phosphate acyltransferase [Gemmatimonadaceae bacterium]
MIYSALRWVNGIALHWFYRDIPVTGRNNIPVDAPLLIAVNHQNALVDSLIVVWVIPRRITMTAKATLTDNPLIALLFKA